MAAPKGPPLPLTVEQLKAMAASPVPTYSFSYDANGKLDAVILAQPIAGTEGAKKLIIALPHEHVLHLAEEVKKRLAQPPKPKQEQQRADDIPPPQLSMPGI